MATAILPPAFSAASAPSYQPPAPNYYDAATLNLNQLSIGPAGEPDPSLPPYVPPPARQATREETTRTSTEHSYELTTSKGKAWLTLKVTSRSPSAVSLPTFQEDDDVSGEVVLDLQKPESIQGVVIKLTGQVVKANSDIQEFLNINEILWDSSKGNPRSPSPDEGKYNEKLVGNFVWPFSMKLPKTTNVSSRQLKDLGLVEHVSLPPSFAERGCFCLLNYELAIIIKRTGIRPQSKLSTIIGYTPRTRPAPPSLLCQMAYREGIPLLDHDVDPAGWYLPPSVEIQGILFAAVKVTIKVSLALCQPLAYTRGSVIPCILSLESSNTAALDLLANPKVPSLGLHRKLNTMVAGEAVTIKAGRRSIPAAGSLLDATLNSHLPVSSAVWWIPRHLDDSPGAASIKGNKRTLHGEIHIPKGVKPSFEFGQFFVKWDLQLLPLKTTGFIPEGAKAVITTPVQITSGFAPGPRPRAYSTDANSNQRTTGDTQVAQQLRHASFL